MATQSTPLQDCQTVFVFCKAPSFCTSKLADILHSFCPRSDHDGDDAELSDICLSRERWKAIVSRFHLNSFLIQAINDKRTVATSVAKRIRRLNGLQTDETGEQTAELPEEREENLWTLTMMTSDDSTFKQNFALSATHFDRKGLTVMVVLGATDQQVRKVRRLLSNNLEVIGHPFVMLGLGAELLLQRLKKMVNDAVDDCIETTRSMRPHALSLSRTPSPNQIISFMDRVQTNRRMSQQIEEEVKLTKAYLNKELPKKTHHEEDEDDEDYIEVTDRFYNRFEYIFLEMDTLMNKSRIYADEMSFNAETVGLPVASSKHQTSMANSGKSDPGRDLSARGKFWGKTRGSERGDRCCRDLLSARD